MAQGLNPIIENSPVGGGGGAAPPPGASALMQAGNDYTQSLKDTDAQGRQIINAEQKEMQPQTNAATAMMNQPGPQQPGFQQTPNSPNLIAEQHKNAEDFLSVSVLVAGIAGLIGRQHTTTALTAFGATVKGFREGQIESGKQAYEEYKLAADGVKENNASMQTEYQNAMANRKMSIDERMNAIQLIATKYHDPLMFQAASARNYMMAANLMERQREAVERYDQADQKMRQQADQFLMNFQQKWGDEATLKNGAQLYKTMFPVSPVNGARVDSTGKPAPEFQQWYDSYYKKLAPGLRSGFGNQQEPQSPQVDKARQLIDAGNPRDKVKAAFIGDGGSADEFDRSFPAEQPDPAVPNTPKNRAGTLGDAPTGGSL